MHFRILGPLEVEDGPQTLRLGGHQQRALLALLLLRANEVVPVDEIVEVLWGAEPPASATKSVHALISKLRRRLEGEAADDPNGETSENGVLLTRPHGYVLRVADGELDLHRFQSLLEEGRGALAAGQAAEAAERLREALALWRGPPLAEFAYDSFAQVEIARLEELRLSGVEERIEAELALGLHRELIPELESLLSKNPLRERLRGQLMLALYRSGRQAQALDAYRRARRTLVDELGIEPTPALQRLEQAILRQDQSLELSRELPPPVAPAGELAAVVETQATRRRLYLRGVAVPAAAAAAAALIALLAFQGGGDSIAVRPNSVAVIDPETNKLVADVEVGKRPGPVDFGAGAVWVANLDDSTLSRINPKTREVERTIPMQHVFPGGIAAGEGGVWVANGPDNEVVRVSPDANEVVDSVATNRCSGYDAGIAVGGGAVWFVCNFGIAQIDPGSNKAHRLRYLGLAPRAITVGLGAVWVSNADNTVSRISPRTHQVETLTVADDPRGLGTGYGAVWVSAFGADAISRLAAAPEAGSRIGSESIRVGDGPVDVAVGAGGVWVANSRDGTVSRIDPQSNKVIATI
ncbi:MAG: BTAD domain-containing putative transcriptional regulator, partial [Thermoleophilia bacterium]